MQPSAFFLATAQADSGHRPLVLLIAALVILAFWRYCRKQMQDATPKE